MGANSPFITTSRLMESLNASLQETAAPDDTLLPRFELQRRLPDGSTRRATESEQAAADMETKLQQTATLIEKMNQEERRTWAQAQREAGNIFYKEEKYKDAIDTYLTCLPAIDQSFPETVDLLLFLKVMNNLSQSCIQLHWSGKAIRFASIALDQIKNGDQERTKEVAVEVVKLYFKRGKAYRLRGDYQEARGDLQIGRVE